MPWPDTPLNRVQNAAILYNCYIQKNIVFTLFDAHIQICQKWNVYEMCSAPRQLRGCRMYIYSGLEPLVSLSGEAAKL